MLRTDARSAKFNANVGRRFGLGLSIVFLFSFYYSSGCILCDTPVLAIHQNLRFVVLAFIDQLQNTLPASLHSHRDEVVPGSDGETGEDSLDRLFF